MMKSSTCELEIIHMNILIVTYNRTVKMGESLFLVEYFFTKLQRIFMYNKIQDALQMISVSEVLTTGAQLRLRS